MGRYIWASFKRLMGGIFDVIKFILSILIAVAIVLFCITVLKWYSLIVAFVLVCGIWVYENARIDYEVDREQAEEQLSNDFFHISKMICNFRDQKYNNDDILSLISPMVEAFKDALEDYRKKYKADATYESYKFRIKNLVEELEE